MADSLDAKEIVVNADDYYNMRHKLIEIRRLLGKAEKEVDEVFEFSPIQNASIREKYYFKIKDEILRQ